jgi:hypothetical protein
MNQQDAYLGISGEPLPEKMLEALHYINTTAAPVFLTGKAGTGKTTFLKNLSSYTYKKFIIVAPTGIAALNAGGVTVHAQFMLPFGMFVPDKELTDELFTSSKVYNQRLLARKNPLNSLRKKILRSIDLLVIDEVSMLRADLLDAIDYRLKSVRNNYYQPFGGVQLLLIGDLHQLPPVVKRDEESLLRTYYRSPWFFESRSLNPETLIYIELDKIFRQQDETFIRILNNLRNNKASGEDIQLINRHYNPLISQQDLKETITLTTHNHQADEINQRALEDLNASPHYFDAKISGEFPESMFPAAHKLVLKTGCQIMFIKNDGEGKMYYNGKLATITDISLEGINVRMEGSNTDYTLTTSVWENKRFRLDESTHEIHDDIIGTFEQYPVKLAWAITIHKSQGLTFDRAIIDPGKAFADGQVYVALSRLRSLDGLTLRSPLNPEVITTDKLIVDFTEHRNNAEPNTDTLKRRQIEFIGRLMIEAFNYDGIVKEIDNHRDAEDNSHPDLKEQSFAEKLSAKLKFEKSNTEKFRKQLLDLFEAGALQQLKERLDKGVKYYLDFLWEQWESLWFHIKEIQKLKKLKGYQERLQEADVLLFEKLEETEKAQQLIWGIVQGERSFDFVKITRSRLARRNAFLENLEIQQFNESKEVRKGKKTNKKDKTPSFEISLKLFEAGLKPQQIAKERNLAETTIMVHLIEGIDQKRISIFDLLPRSTVDKITGIIKSMPDSFRSKDVFDKLNGAHTYPEIRAVMNHLGLARTTKEISEDA